MKFNIRIPYFFVLLPLFWCVFVVCEVAVAQELSSHERQPKIVPEETKKFVEDLFQKYFTHRERIQTGQMTITHTIATGGRNNTLENGRVRKIMLAFDKERHRVDLRDMFRNDPSYVAVGCIGCYEEDNRLLAQYSQRIRKDKPSQRSVLSIFDTTQRFKGQEVTSTWTQQLSFIPQNILLFSTNRFPTKDRIESEKDLFFSTTIGTFDSGVTEATITKEQYKGTECKKIIIDATFSTGAQVLITLWFAEGQGYALRKHSLQISGMKSKDYDELLEVDVALDKDSSIWFPSAWHYERNNQGKPLYREDGIVKDVVLNKPIPDKIFTMQDMDIIPAGIMVQWNTDNFPPPHGEKRVGYLLWDGNKIVTRGMFAESLVAKSASETANSRRIRVVIFVNVAVISLLCAIFLWRYYHRLK